jgi:tetratricopeptide (TPR) repeat protein
MMKAQAVWDSAKRPPALMGRVAARMASEGASSTMGRETQKPPVYRGRYGISAFVLALSGLMLCGSSTVFAQNNSNAQKSGAQPTQSFEQLTKRARAAQDANQLPEAIRLYQKATALRPSWSEGWWYLGTMLFDSNQIAQAHDAFLHFVSVEHKQPGPGFGMLGLTEFELKNYRKALDAVERGRALGLGDNPAFVQRVLYVDGILNNDLGQPEIALARLTRVANLLAAEHPEALRETVLEDTELLDALGLAALRIRQLPTEISSGQAELVRKAGHAQALILIQDPIAAGAEIKQLVDQHPSEPGVHYMYGVFLLDHDSASAVDQFRREIEISPRSPFARIQLALQFLHTGDYEQGLKYAQEAVALAPDNFISHVACGSLWLELGNTDHALHELRIAVRMSPGSPEAHFALSRALSAAGQSGDAARERAEFERLKTLTGANDRQQRN